MDSNRTRFLNAENSNLYGTLYNIFAKKNIINIGIITDVIDENTINVRLYDSDDSGKLVIINSVRLLHIGTSKCRIIIQPAVGDIVLLLASKDYIDKLEYNHSSTPKEINSEAYSNSTIQGILISPEEDDNNKTGITINENGNIALETLGKIDVSIKDSFSDSGKKLVDFVMDTAKTFTLTTYDNGSAKNTIKMDSDGVTINNNLSVANT